MGETKRHIQISWGTPVRSETVQLFRAFDSLVIYFARTCVKYPLTLKSQVFTGKSHLFQFVSIVLIRERTLLFQHLGPYLSFKLYWRVKIGRDQSPVNRKEATDFRGLSGWWWVPNILLIYLLSTKDKRLYSPPSKRIRIVTGTNSCVEIAHQWN